MGSWTIVITAEDGTVSAWGSWRNPETADHLADKLREYCDRPYAPEYDVTVLHVGRWPGLARARDELHA